jgi:hypothetical protein
VGLSRRGAPRLPERQGLVIIRDEVWARFRYGQHNAGPIFVNLLLRHAGGMGGLSLGGGLGKARLLEGSKRKDEDIANKSSLTDGGVSAALPKLKLPLPARHG